MKILIYGTIGSSLFSTGVSASEVIAQLDEDEADPVALYVNSGGGDVFEGIAIHNALKRHQGRVTVYIDGLAASAASVIAMAGDEIVMPENTMMMVHNPWTMAIGGADDLRKTADILDQTRDAIVTAYRDKTGMDEDELRTLLDDETWLSAKDAVAFGFADRLEAPLEEEEAVAAFASIDLSQMKKVPQAIMSMAQRATTKAANAAAHEGDSMTEKQQKAASPATSIDLDAVKAEAMKAERERSGAILAEATRVGLNRDTVDAIVAKGLHVEASRGLIIDAIAEQQQKGRPVISGVHSAITNGDDSLDKFHAGAVQAIMARAGVEKHDTKNSLTGRSLTDLARKSLEIRGMDINGSNDDVAGRVFLASNGITHSAGDFTSILKDVAYKSMLMGWEEHEESFMAWTRVGSLSDFKVNHRVALNLADDLLELGELGEIKSGTIGDRGETIQLKTFARKFGISRHALVNDDLSAFVTLPGKMGRAARRTVGNEVYKILTAGQTLADGVDIFHASRNNSNTTAFGADGLKALKAKMRTQKDPDSKASLNITPRYLIVPAALELDALVLTTSSSVPGATNEARNPFAGMAEVIVEGRLDDASPTKYYGAADPGMYDTIEVAYLNGVQAPFLDQQQGFTIDGTEFKVRLDFAARALDFRGLFKSGT